MSFFDYFSRSGVNSPEEKAQIEAGYKTNKVLADKTWADSAKADSAYQQKQFGKVLTPDEKDAFIRQGISTSAPASSPGAAGAAGAPSPAPDVAAQAGVKDAAPKGGGMGGMGGSAAGWAGAASIFADTLKEGEQAMTEQGKGAIPTMGGSTGAFPQISKFGFNHPKR